MSLILITIADLDRFDCGAQRQITRVICNARAYFSLFNFVT